MTIVSRKPSQMLVDLVGALGGSWHGHTAMCRCPAHADRTPSLSIRQGDRGLLVTCFAGCDPIDILRELGRIPLGRRYEPPEAAPRSSTANIDRLWDAAMPVHGTLAERYLASRRLLPVAADLRFHARCPLGPKPRTKFKPALLVGVRGEPARRIPAHLSGSDGRIYREGDAGPARIGRMAGWWRRSDDRSCRRLRDGARLVATARPSLLGSPRLAPARPCDDPQLRHHAHPCW